MGLCVAGLKGHKDAVCATGPLNVANTLPERQQPEATAHRKDPRIGDGHNADKPHTEQQPEEDELSEATDASALRLHCVCCPWNGSPRPLVRGGNPLAHCQR